MHFCHELFNVSTNQRAALSEQVDIHVDLALRKSAKLPSDKIDLLRCLVRAARRQTLPRGLGRSLRVPQNAWLEDVRFNGEQ
jgi:acyl-CoA thioester hydrolase